MPSRWGDGFLGYVKFDFLPLLELARGPSPSLHVCLLLFPDCIDLVLVLVGAGGWWDGNPLLFTFPWFFLFFFGISPCRVGYQFLDIPSGTRDLTRHLEDLTWQYPVEPVERTSLRFCEALAQWRGKPELENVSPDLHSESPPSPIEMNSPFLSRSSHPIPPLPLPFSVFCFSLYPMPCPSSLLSELTLLFSCRGI